MKDFPELKEMGLDNNEIKVYLSCLVGQGMDVKQVSQKTRLIRTTVYGILKSLMDKGLVSSIKTQGVMIFRSASPKELINILDQKKAKIESIVPDLLKIQKFKPEIQKVEHFQGKEGVKTITNDIISIPNTTVKVMGIGQEWLEFSEIFTSIYYRKKKEMNVHTKTILADTKKERSFLAGKKFANSEIRFIKNNDFAKSVVYIYHNKVSFVVYDKEKPRGYIITDKQLNKAQNAVFDRLWLQSRK